MSASDVLCKALALFRMSILLLFVLCLLWIPSAPGPRFAAGARHELVLPEPYFDVDSRHWTLYECAGGDTCPGSTY